MYASRVIKAVTSCECISESETHRNSLKVLVLLEQVMEGFGRRHMHMYTMSYMMQNNMKACQHFHVLLLEEDDKTDGDHSNDGTSQIYAWIKD